MGWMKRDFLDIIATGVEALGVWNENNLGWLVAGRYREIQETIINVVNLRDLRGLD